MQKILEIYFDNLIEKVGKTIGEQCNTVGVHLNFAPVIDINTNPRNPIIGNRSFGESKENVTNKKKTLAVRFPRHPVTRLLLKKINFPLAAPSANISTSISPVMANDVREEFGNKIKYILDGGRSQIGLESTIIDLVTKPKILRLGGLKLENINSILNSNLKYKSNNNLKFPGQSKLHYSPGIPIKLNIKHPKNNSAYILIQKKKYNNKNFYYLSKKRNLTEAGENLYRILRKIKKKNYKLIEVEKIPNYGIGQTINDRLKRASS